jgi:hypothetical protein
LGRFLPIQSNAGDADMKNGFAVSEIMILKICMKNIYSYFTHLHCTPTEHMNDSLHPPEAASWNWRSDMIKCNSYCPELHKMLALSHNMLTERVI